MRDLLTIRKFLEENNVLQGDDVFIHGFHLPENTIIEDFSTKIFNEGIKKHENFSILSTVSLIPHDKNLDEYISNYVLRGRFRIILKIPEKLNDFFFGRCRKQYGSTGNQYSKSSMNSILDYFGLAFIPNEFIVGIIYTDKQMYEYNEEILYNFIQNPNYFDHKTNKEKNRETLYLKFKKLIKEENDFFLNYFIKGNKTGLDTIQTFRNHPLLPEGYEFFIDQREEYDIANTQSLNNQEISN